MHDKISPVDMTATLASTDAWHVERHTSLTTGRPILVRCFCRLGRNHDYPEWLAARGCWSVEDLAVAAEVTTR